MAKQKIFFSYSRVDGSAFALRLAVDLKKKGFDVWIDQEDIRAGLDWDTEIESALESCDYVLFLETEKSVVSKNVLDEIYYALDQNKKVIPLIYVDSKTPYRLNRLQNIDFTKNYETGLALLVNELEGNGRTIAYPTEESTLPSAPNKPPYTKNYTALLVIAGLVVLIIAAVVFTTKNRNASSAETGNKGVAVGSANEKAGSAELIKKTPQGDSDNMNEIVAGDWQLIGLEPEAQSQNGYLKIEVSGENKASIKAYMQFYYRDSKTPPYLTVFNAFVGCTSCAVNKEMKLKVEDIAVGTTNSNKSIRGAATLQFVDYNTAIIKVAQPLPVELANELMLDPFVYTFRFKKSD
jgi:hypothetical protein